MSDEKLIRIFEQMLRIRRFEEGVFELHTAGAFGGHYHLYIGQEATGAAVINALKGIDPIFSTHRNHGHAIARGIEPEAAFAEILGKASGSQGGRGGTFHLADPEVAMPHTSALVGGAVPLAAGAALAAKQNRTGAVAVALFGDGCFEEGVVYETLNLARMWQLPVMFICENNTPGSLAKAKGGNNTSNLPDGRVADTPRALKIKTFEVDGSDAIAVSELMVECRKICAEKSQPIFVEAFTERWPGNVYSFPSMVTGMTDFGILNEVGVEKKEHSEWFDKGDPVLTLARVLLKKNLMNFSEITALNKRVIDEINQAKERALAAPEPALESFSEFVLFEEAQS